MIPRARFNEIPHFQASLWLKLPLILSIEEMQDLVAFFPEPLFPLGGLIFPEDEYTSKTHFLESYRNYLDAEKEKVQVNKLSFAITHNPEDLRAISCEKGVLHKIFSPVIQVQPYTLHFSFESQKFHEMTFSPDSFYWGLLFSFPQIYNNPVSKKVEKVTEEKFSSAKLFKEIQKWSRAHTVPTPFFIGDKKRVHPARIGKQLLLNKPLMTKK